MSYEQSASIYDAIYTAMKDYRRESERLHAIIMARLQSFDRRYQVPSLLDVACGTGLHLEHLRNHFRVEGLDISEAQLQIAWERFHRSGAIAREVETGLWTSLDGNFTQNLDQLQHGAGRLSYGRGIQLYLADMVTFTLGRQYDVVTCLFSAIGHLSAEQLPAAITNMARHVAPGGLLIVEPWLSPHMWRSGHVSMQVVDQTDLKVVRISRSTKTGKVIHLELEHLVARPEGTEHFIELHDLTMFDWHTEFRPAFEDAGLIARFEEGGIGNNGRGLIVGRKPLEG